MAVVTISQTNTATYNAGATTQDFTFTVASGDQLAVFFIIQDSANSNAISSVTWDAGGTAQACTLVKGQVCSSLTNGSVNAYAVVNPTPGTLILEIKQALSQGMTAECVTFINVANASVATACTQAASAATSNQTIAATTITGAQGDMSVAAFMNIGTWTANTDTLIYSLSPTGKDSIANQFSFASAGTHALGATQNAIQQAAWLTFDIVFQAQGGTQAAFALWPGLGRRIIAIGAD